MPMTVYDGAGGRAAPVHGILRHAVARVVVARSPRVNARLLGLDDAGVATVAADRRPLQYAAQVHLPL